MRAAVMLVVLVGCGSDWYCADKGGQCFRSERRCEDALVADQVCVGRDQVWCQDDACYEEIRYPERGASPVGEDRSSRRALIISTSGLALALLAGAAFFRFLR